MACATPRGSGGCGSVAEGRADDPAVAVRPAPTILHVDMDSFFASVEVLDHPELAGKPVVVGGSHARGVVASCTYEARAYGIHSAMPSARARQLCPDAVFIDGHYSRYAEVSARLREVLLGVTPVMEPVGLDEAFLDVTGALRLLGPPEQIARDLRSRVRTELSLDCSVGVGRSKMIAKLASRAAKPTAGRNGTQPGLGVVVVAEGEELAFLHPMPVERLWGVGPATSRRLHDLGVATVGELAAVPEAVLVRRLGRAQGSRLRALARAEDTDPVVADRAAKSVGHEETFADDISDRALLGRHVWRMAESVASHLRGGGQVARTVSVKVKYGDHTAVSRSHTLPWGVDTGSSIAAIASVLLDTVDLRDGVRLFGISASALHAAGDGRQLSFGLGVALRDGSDGGDGGDAGDARDAGDAGDAGDTGDGIVAGAGVGAALAAGVEGRATPRTDGATRRRAALEASRRQQTWEELMGVVDAIRQRFGTASVGSVSMVRADGIAVPARREAPWGPAASDSGEEHPSTLQARAHREGSPADLS